MLRVKFRIIDGAPRPQVVRPGSLTTTSTSPRSTSSLAVVPRASQSFDYHEYLRTETIQSNEPLQLAAHTRNLENFTEREDLPRFMSDHGNLSGNDSVDISKSWFVCPSIRVTFSYRWSCSFCDFALRIGPTIALKTTGNREAKFSAHYRKIGFGLGFSLNMPGYCRRKLDIALCLMEESVRSRLRMSLHWVIDCPRIIPRRSEIMQCVAEGSVDDVQRLLSAGRATARDVSIHGTTLLHLASKTGNLYLIRLLIQEGGDVNAKNEYGDTPLHWAMARGGNYKVARLLIENGADLANNTDDKRTPLRTYFNDTVEKVLLRDDSIEETFPNAEGMSIVHYSAWSSKSSSKIFKRSMAYTSTGLWSVDGYGRTCLHLAASRGNIDVLGYLLERSSLAEVRRTDNEGRTALHYAVQSKRSKTIDLLLASGGNLYAGDNASRTVLHYAARWENLEAAQKVVAVGNKGILCSPDKDGIVPSALVQGRKAIALRRFLMDLEATAGIETDLNRQIPMYQESPRTGLIPEAKIGTFLSKPSLIYMLPFATGLSASKCSLRNIMTYLLPTIILILCLLVCATKKPL